MNSLLFSELVYRGSYIVLARLIVSIRNGFRYGKIGKVFLFMMLGGLFIWGRFVEPQKVVVKHTNIDLGIEKSVAVIGDLHLGVFKDWHYLQRVVNKINRQDGISMVLIPGDFLNMPLKNQELIELFAPLADLDVPVYAVLGNHDVGLPGEQDHRLELIRALEENNVYLLHNDIVGFDSFYLVGLGPHLSGEDDTRLLERFTDEDTVITVTHNPDSISNYTTNNSDLTIVGHTHCGQIRIPYIYPLIRSALLPVEGNFDCGYTQEDTTKLFITPGIGEVILPIRFNVPPTIDILHL